jgi:hypothetical protein
LSKTAESLPPDHDRHDLLEIVAEQRSAERLSARIQRMLLRSVLISPLWAMYR